MLYDGIGFNQEWAQEHTEDEFVKQHKDAFAGTDHPLAKMNAAERQAYLKKAYAILCPSKNVSVVHSDKESVVEPKKGAGK